MAQVTQHTRFKGRLIHKLSFNEGGSLTSTPTSMSLVSLSLFLVAENKESLSAGVAQAQREGQCID